MLKTERIDEPLPLDNNEMDVGLSVTVMPDRLVVLVRKILPTNPFKLANPIVAVPVEPMFTWIDWTDAMLKSTILTVMLV